MIKLSAKEEEVMELIWKLGECTPREVYMLYDEPRPLLNGIQNTFQSLERKGYLSHRQQGRGYLYEPIVEKNSYGKSKLGSLVDRFLDGSVKDLVTFFAREQKLSAEELREIINEIEQNHPSNQSRKNIQFFLPGTLSGRERSP